MPIAVVLMTITMFPPAKYRAIALPFVFGANYCWRIQVVAHYLADILIVKSLGVASNLRVTIGCIEPVVLSALVLSKRVATLHHFA